jgi:hypothetical protein
MVGGNAVGAADAFFQPPPRAQPETIDIGRMLLDAPAATAPGQTNGFPKVNMHAACRRRSSRARKTAGPERASGLQETRHGARRLRPALVLEACERPGRRGLWRPQLADGQPDGQRRRALTAARSQEQGARRRRRWCSHAPSVCACTGGINGIEGEYQGSVRTSARGILMIGGREVQGRQPMKPPAALARIVAWP